MEKKPNLVKKEQRTTCNQPGQRVGRIWTIGSVRCRSDGQYYLARHTHTTWNYSTPFCLIMHVWPIRMRHIALSRKREKKYEKDSDMWCNSAISGFMHL